MDKFLLLAIPLAPLSAAAMVPLFQGRGERHAGTFTSCGAAVAFLLVLSLSSTSPHVQSIWLRSAGFSLTVGLQLDGLSWFMALLVAGVGFLVVVYSSGYLAEEPGRARFFATLCFFLGAMLTLVLADSFLLLFAAWEAVGVASYLLIGFRYGEERARRAALRAFLTTRCADLGLLLGWLWILQRLETTDFRVLFEALSAGTLSETNLSVLALLFFAAAVGKSAQVPLTSWLPEAMAGPSPVSALIHSATMVAAGVYLLLRFYSLFFAAPYALPVLLAVGAATAMLAALMAATEFDLKRVLAWSTASQLGEMMMAIGLGGAFAAAFHLGTHAVFKATLFLAAGAVDRQAGTRDLRRLGRLGKTMPITALVYGAAGLALAGVPPFSGYWSEEAVLAGAVSRHFGWGILLIALIFLAGLYISRSAVAVFSSWPDAPGKAAPDPAVRMKTSMALLALAALGLGWLLSIHLETVLRFSPAGNIAWGWRAAAIAASAAGLGFGAWQVRRHGPVPAFGRAPCIIEKSLYALTDAPARWAMACAGALERLEQGLALAAPMLARAAGALARAESAAERLLDSAARAAAGGAMQLGEAADGAEQGGFAAGAERIAAYVARAAGELQFLQSGRLYLYTLGIFIWVLVVGLFGFLLRV